MYLTNFDVYNSIFSGNYVTNDISGGHGGGIYGDIGGTVINEVDASISAARLYVNGNVAASGDGTSWEQAFKTLEEAFEHMEHRCSAAEKIWVAAGVYKPNKIAGNGTTDRDKAFLPPSHIKIYGSFAGTETSLEQRDLSNPANRSILSGDFNDNDVVTGSGETLSISGNEENASRVVILMHTTNTVLDGFIIKGGNAIGSNDIRIGTYTLNNDDGAGIYGYQADARIVNCIFTQNTAARGGAFFTSEYSYPVVENCLFLHNIATTNGSALTTLYNFPIVNCTFWGNRGTGSNTSAVYAGANYFTMRNSIIYGNNGGFDHNGNGAGLNITNCLIQGQTPAVDGNIDGNLDPLFRDPDNGDFRLQSNSPLIDQGDNSYVTTTLDLLGNPRIGNGIVDIGAFEFTPPSSLPVTLIHFTGVLRNGIAELRWKTGIEENFSHFEIQQAVVVANEEQFKTIGTLNAKGNNSAYTFYAPQTEPVAFYRLKMVDIDNRESYSKIIPLAGQADNSVQLYPNPAKDHITITVDRAGSLSIYDAWGRHIRNEVLRAGINRVDLRGVKAGVYFGMINGVPVQFVKE
jgi:hypothetical protein